MSTYQNGLGSPGYQPLPTSTDINNDGTVNILDLVLVASQIGQSAAGNAADVNSDGIIDASDLALVAAAFGTSITN